MLSLRSFPRGYILGLPRADLRPNADRFVNYGDCASGIRVILERDELASRPSDA